MDRKILDIIGVQMDFGASKRGVSMGPSAIRYGGLIEGLCALGFEVEDLGDIMAKGGGESRENMRYHEQVVDVNRRVYEKVLQSLERGHFPITLGGDHSIAAGSISAVSRYYSENGRGSGKIGLLWIDAHGDWNNDKSTPSGNMHGMPFSAVCGGGPDCMADFGRGPVFLDTSNCVQIGGRDIDPAERVRMKESGVKVFHINLVDRLGMESVIREAIEIAGRDTEGIHLSFDIDALSPEYAPGTGTIVQNGLTAREAFLALEILAESGKLISMDMVEVNPILDEHNKTGILASELIQSALGKVVF